MPDTPATTEDRPDPPTDRIASFRRRVAAAKARATRAGNAGEIRLTVANAEGLLTAYDDLRAQRNAALDLADRAEVGALRCAGPRDVPEWVYALRRAIRDGTPVEGEPYGNDVWLVIASARAAFDAALDRDEPSAVASARYLVARAREANSPSGLMHIGMASLDGLLDAYDQAVAGRNTWRAKAMGMEAARDRLIAQVERVRALIVDYEAVFEHGQCGDDCNLCAAHDFRSALDNPDLGSTQDGADR